MQQSPPILSFGLLTWVGFLYIGVRAKRSAWWIPAVVYFVAVAVAFAIPSDVRVNAAGEEITESSGGGIVLAAWVAGIVHAVIVNRSWLRWRAAHSGRAWYEDRQSSAAGHAPPPGGAPVAPPSTPPRAAGPAGTVDRLVEPRAAYFADGPAGAPRSREPLEGPREGSARQASPAPSPVEGRLIDVNAAGPAELAGLPGVSPEQAELAVAHRRARGRFRSISDFAEVVGVKPHERVRLEREVTCGAPVSREPGRGPGSGRVLDF